MPWYLCVLPWLERRRKKKTDAHVIGHVVDSKGGMSLYGYYHNRKPFDANDDGFPELTVINNLTIGSRYEEARDFDEKVKSLAFENNEGNVTAGIMAPGEFEFGTSTLDYMTVVSSKLTVLLPGEDEWKTYGPYETFIVKKDKRFRVKVEEETAYKCVYK